MFPSQCVGITRVSEDWLYLPSLYSLFSFSLLVHSLLIVPLLILLVLSLDMLVPSFLFNFISHYHSPFSWKHSSVFHLPPPKTLYLPYNHNRPLFLPSCFSCDRFPVSSSLLRGKAVNPSLLHWPIESCWAPILLLIGWAGLSRYWEEGLALLAFWLSAYLSVCLHDLLCLCSRADLKSVSSGPPKYKTWDFPTKNCKLKPGVVIAYVLMLEPLRRLIWDAVLFSRTLGCAS